MEIMRARYFNMLSKFFRNHCFACLLKLLAKKEKKRRKKLESELLKIKRPRL